MLDLFAFRIVVNRIDDCYRALGIVHSRYKPISGEFNDFIAIPKINGYQSLHTTVHGEFGRMIEIQIRTEEMHRVAETGIASHLRYKSGVNSSTSVNFPSVQWLSDVLHSLEEHESPGEYLGNLKLSLFSDDVFVFTPKGEIKRLKRGATVIDFAYSVHSDVGNRAKQAYVNSQRVGFHTILSNGDHVEIVHKRGGKPDPGWLNFAVTGKARMSIRNALKKSSRKDVEKMGKRLFKNALKKYSIRSSDITDAMKDKLVSRLNLQSWSDVVYDVGMGQRMAAVIVRQMIPDLFKESNPADTPDYSVAIQGTEGLGVQYGGCCNPIPNDDIVGFFSRGRGIVIHNVTCQNVHQSKYGPENWGKFHWVDYPQGTFRVPIRLDVMNKKGVLAEITARIAALETNISACNISTHGESAVIEFEIDVTDRKHLARIIKGLKRNTSVHKIQRIKFR